MNPDDVARMTFSSSRKGYDPMEVQGFLVSVSAELRESRSRVLELEQELRAALQDADRNREVDPSRLTALLGEETVRVLDAARGAADDMRAKAAESTSRLVREATDDAARMRREAAEVLTTKTREAEVEVEAVKRQIEEMRTKARADAAAEVEAGRQEGREMVAEAQKVRERMLNDLARRRKAFRQQIERLQAGRDRLLSAYDVVRDTLDIATEELQVALPEARVAAESASVRAGDEDEATLEELELEAASLPDVKPAEAPAQPAESAESGGDETGPEVAEVAADAGDGPAAGADEATAVTEAAVEAEPMPLAPSTELEGRRSSSVKVIKSSMPEGEAEVESTTLATTEPTADRAAAPATAAQPESDADAGSDEAEAEPESPAQVSNLFARIRSETEIQAEADEQAAAAAAAAEAEVVVAEEFELVEETEADLSPPAPVAPAARVEPAADAADDETTPDEAPVGPDSELIARRDAALVDIERALGRRIKRELSDEQNELLDSVRRQKGVPSVAEVLPALAVHIARYRDGALASLATAATAGADLLDGPKAGAATKTKAADLATELATELVEPLRDRIERCFVEAADDDEELAERLRACYREWKGQRVDELASRYAVAASNRGLLDRLPKGTLVHWVVDDGSTPSPDCDDNALAGDQPKGEPFPTGHIAPPISATCRCMVVPATS
jgi:cell division septum initiation protein DivIVA